MKLNDVTERPVALVLVTEDVEDEWGMYYGAVERRDDGIVFVYRDGTTHPLREEHVDAIRPVPEELDEVIDEAELMLPVRAPV